MRRGLGMWVLRSDSGLPEGNDRGGAGFVTPTSPDAGWVRTLPQKQSFSLVKQRTDNGSHMTNVVLRLQHD